MTADRVTVECIQQWLEALSQSGFLRGLTVGESGPDAISAEQLVEAAAAALRSLQAEVERLGSELECWKKNDRCELCNETRGGIPGNGQHVDGILMCDYCHADHLKYPRFWEVTYG